MAEKGTDQKDDNPKYPTITRAELAGGYFNKHVAFVIKTPSGAEIKRRYTDFEWLRQLLRILYPGAFIPPIPPKLPVAMWPQGYLLMRKRELQQFLQRLEVIPYLKAEEVTSFFLSKHSSAFDKARKKWQKEHPAPSHKALFEKLQATFPKIHETATPEDMDKRCEDSSALIAASLKELSVMVKASEAFIESTRECADAMADFNSALSDLAKLEQGDAADANADAAESVAAKYCSDVRVDVSGAVSEWAHFRREEAANMSAYYVPTLNRALNDLTVIKEILTARDKIQGEYAEAKKKAEAWKDGATGDSKAIRSSDLARKHREVQREEDLRNLSEFVEKLVLGQLNVVFCANTRRWKKSVTLFASKHLVALERVCGSWKGLHSEILKGKGGREELVVESMDTDGQESEEKGGDDKEDEKQEVEVEVERFDAEKAEAEERERVEREKEEARVKAEAERVRKEKQEQLEKERAASKKKMDAMFQDGDDKPDNEFPWEDDK